MKTEGSKIRAALSGDTQLSLVVTTGLGCEDVLALEIERLAEMLQFPASSFEVMPGSVSLRGSFTTLVGLNLGLRTASRVLWVIAAAPFRNLKDVYQLGREVSWHEIFDVSRSFAIQASADHPEIRNPIVLAQAIKDSIVDDFAESVGSRPCVDVQRPDVPLTARLKHGRVEIALDTSGGSLTHHGLTRQGVEAPLRETLAAGLLELAGWGHLCERIWTDAEPQFFERVGEDQPQKSGDSQRRMPARPLLYPCFFDPMCGSGTLLAEAGMMLLKRWPSLISGRRFAFENWSCAEDISVLADALRSRLRANEGSVEELTERVSLYHRRVVELGTVKGFSSELVLSSRQPLLYGSDNDPAAVELSRENLARHGLDLIAEVTTAALATRTPMAPSGLIVTNPPYGERLETTGPATEFYQDLGNWMKRGFPGWTAWVISSNLRALKRVGLRPTRRHTIFNGPLECRFCQFVLF